MFRAGGDGTGEKYELATTIYTKSDTFTMPAGVKDNQVYVRIFGGGSNGHWSQYTGINSRAGGGGWMNNGWVSLNIGEAVAVTIGAGGGQSYSSAGGSTSFGSYLSANGASATNSTQQGASGYGGSSGGLVWNESVGISASVPNAYQFGGGGAYGNKVSSGVGGTFDGYRCGNGGLLSNWWGNKYATDGVNTISIISESD